MRVTRSGELALAAEPAARAPAASGAPPGTTRGTAREPPGPSFSEVLRGIGRQLERGEATLTRAVQAPGGTAMSPQALIALQASVYRYTEVVDLATKLVDRAAGAVKTTLQNQ